MPFLLPMGHGWSASLAVVWKGQSHRKHTAQVQAELPLFATKDSLNGVHLKSGPVQAPDGTGPQMVQVPGWLTVLAMRCTPCIKNMLLFSS